MAAQATGFIGLGVMGGPMAGHLAAAGHAVTVYDIGSEAVARLQALHPQVKAADTPAAVAAASDIVITMLPSGKQVRETALGAGGLIEGFRPGSLLLDTSSAEPWLTKEVGGRLAEIGVAMVDAPVSGAEVGAKTARLVFMVGGQTADVERVLPILNVLGQAHFHLGPLGSGHVMKAINNLISAVTLTSTTEGLLAGTAYGLDPVVMRDVLNASTGGSWVSQTCFDRIFSRRFDDAFKLDLMKKDIDIANVIASDLGLDLPHFPHIQGIWAEVQREAPPGASLNQLVRALELKAGVELKPKDLS